MILTFLHINIEGVVQLVEQRIPNAQVVSSTLATLGYKIRLNKFDKINIFMAYKGIQNG